MSSPSDTTDKQKEVSIDKSRRKFLTTGFSIVGGIGVSASAWPFIASMNPSARAHAIGAPVTINIGQLEPGEILRNQWRGKPVWIVRRTEKQIKSLRRDNKRLRDPLSQRQQQPEYARNYHRSIRPDILVLVGVCTHLGCAPSYHPEPSHDDGKQGGGFLCACHGSRFDMSGRVYKNVPAPKNLEVPPYYFANDDTVVIGQDSNIA